MVFHKNLSDSKCPEVSRTILSILADLNNAVVWMISARPPIFNSASPFTKPLWIVHTNTIGIAVIFKLHCF